MANPNRSDFVDYLNRLSLEQLACFCYDAKPFTGIYRQLSGKESKATLVRQVLKQADAQNYYETWQRPTKAANLSSKTNVTYTNLEIRLGHKTGQTYTVELTLNKTQQFEGAILEFTSDLTIADGEQLFQWLLSDTQLRQQWHKIQGQHPYRRLRLRIDRDASELEVIPWELLREADTQGVAQILASDTDTPFSRYIAGPWSVTETPLKPPLKLLLAIANPINLADYKLAPINIEAEQAVIQNALSAVQPGQVEVTLLPQPCSLANLAEALNDAPHLLHIVAHGHYSNRHKKNILYLANKDNVVSRVSETDWAEMLGRLDSVPPFIFFASCHSASQTQRDTFQGLGPLSIQAGALAVLAMQDAVAMQTAQPFTQTFYRQLLAHGQVDLACNQARAQLINAALAGSSTPVLYSRLANNQLLQP